MNVLPTNPYLSVSDNDQYANNMEVSVGKTHTGNKRFDPVNILTDSIQFNLPVHWSNHVNISLEFNAVGFFNVYVQQAAIPNDDILIQIKFLSVRLPGALGIAIFNLLAALFLIKAFLLAVREAVSDATSEFKQILLNVLQKIDDKNSNH